MPSPFPVGQSWLINRIQALGYPIGKNGMCNGMAHMSMQAILAEDVQSFEQRLNEILKIPAKFFVKHIETLQRVRKTSPSSLNDKQLLLLETPAFFEGILLYHQSDKLPYLFSKEDVHEFQEPTKAMRYAYPLSLKSDDVINPIKSVAKFTGMYTLAELQNYFISLQCAYTKENVQKAIPMILSSPDHAMTVAYDPKLKKWLWIDANYLPVQYFDSANQLAEKVLTTFSDNKQTTFCTILFSKPDDEVMVASLAVTWQLDRRMEKMHQVTVEKVHAADSAQFAWLQSAVLFNVKDEAMAIVEKLKQGNPPYNFIGSEYAIWRKYRVSPLELAELAGNTEIAKLLCSKQSNIRAKVCLFANPFNNENEGIESNIMSRKRKAI